MKARFAALKGLMRTLWILSLTTTLWMSSATASPAAPDLATIPTLLDPIFTAAVHEGFAWVVADQPSEAAYTPAASKQYNSQRATNTVARTSLGLYTITFTGLGGIHGGNVQVTALGDGPTHCKVRRWSAKFATVSAQVACFDAGLAADSAFIVSFQATRTATALETAYAWVPSTATGVSYTPAEAYSRNVASIYRPIDQVLLGGSITSLALEHVTSYGESGEHCVFRENRTVSCFDGTGARVSNAAYSYATGLGRISTSIPSELEGAFGVMDLPWDWVTTTTATPQGSTLSSGALTVTKTGTGRYTVDVPYPSVFGRGSVPSMVHVTALDITGGNRATQCKVAKWSDDGTTRVAIQVRCFSMSPATFGAPINMGFRVSYIVRPPPLFFLPFIPLDVSWLGGRAPLGDR